MNEKKDPTFYAQEIYFKYKNTGKSKVKEWSKNLYHTNINQKKAQIDILRSVIVDFIRS